MKVKQIVDQSRASQDKFELERLLQIVSKIIPKTIVEIGVHLGGFMETLKLTFPDAYIYGIDNGDWPTKQIPMGTRLLQQDSHSPATLKSLETLVGTQIDFLFIDGDHTYEGVKQDYLMYAPLVREGGIIAFHDIMRQPGIAEGVEVRRFWDEIRQKNLTLKGSIELWGGPHNNQGPHISDAPGTGILFK